MIVVDSWELVCTTKECDFLIVVVSTGGRLHEVGVGSVS